MFSALENTLDQSARRRWTTLASFTMQALGLSLLLAIPLLTVQGPPRLRWITSPFFWPPPAPAPPSSATHRSSIHSSNMRGDQIVAPPSIPDRIADMRETGAPAAPNLGDTGVPGGTGLARPGVPGGLGDTIAIAPPAPTRPLRVSRWAEGNLIYRVQPAYPSLARQARIQGSSPAQRDHQQNWHDRKADGAQRTRDAGNGGGGSRQAMALSSLSAEWRPH